MGHDSGSIGWREHLRRAVQIAGGQRNLAVLCGVSQHAIWAALNKGIRVSPDLAARIVKATFGEVRFSQLSPELFVIVSAEVARESAA